MKDTKVEIVITIDTIEEIIVIVAKKDQITIVKKILQPSVILLKKMFFQRINIST